MKGRKRDRKSKERVYRGRGGGGGGGERGEEEGGEEEGGGRGGGGINNRKGGDILPTNYLMQASISI